MKKAARKTAVKKKAKPIVRKVVAKKAAYRKRTVRKPAPARKPKLVPTMNFGMVAQNSLNMAVNTAVNKTLVPSINKLDKLVADMVALNGIASSVVHAATVIRDTFTPEFLAEFMATPYSKLREDTIKVPANYLRDLFGELHAGTAAKQQDVVVATATQEIKQGQAVVVTKTTRGKKVTPAPTTTSYDDEL